jgi:phosphonate transport system substrate-binding protein
MTKKSSFFVVIFACLLIFSCDTEKSKRVIVDFQGPAPDSSIISFHQDEAIHVAIAAMTSPRESFVYYNELLQHISSLIGMPVHYIQKESYQEVNQLLEDGAVDFAFICSGAYIEAKEDKTIDLLVAPVISGVNTYTAYIICHKNNKAYHIKDLKGRSFAFSDPLSHTGFNYPVKLLKDKDIDYRKFFKKTLFTYGHDLSIQMVDRGIVDAASVHGLIFDYLMKFNPDKIENVHIVEESKPFGIPPVVTPKSLDPRRYKLYKNIFLNLHRDPVGKRILDNINIDYYTEIEDEMYDSVREIKALADD